jgi:TonB-dependent starch-binding outer membrane protein SusC
MKTKSVLGCLLAVLLLAAPAVLHAQNMVAGRVVSADARQPLPGVDVRVKDGVQGTITGPEGRYQLSVPTGAVLVFSTIGYSALEVAVDGRSVVDVALTPTALALSELVVVGYTSEIRRNVTGAVSGVRADEILTPKVATVEQSLRGRVAGVRITTSGEPGQPAAMVVRGQNFLYRAEPLYVVDGLYMTQNPNLNPNDIESIQVLKDASASSQYGAQAANGVVVITTKSGRTAERERNRLQLRSYYGMEEASRRWEVMNAREWADFAYLAYTNAGQAVPQGVLDIRSGAHTVDTNWQDEILRRGGIQDHNLSMLGNTDNATYYVSAGYTQQDGTIIKTDFERYSLRVNSELTLGRLRLGENLALVRSNKNNLTLNEGSPMVQAMRMPPGIPVRDANNLPAYGYGSAYLPNFGTNPVGMLEQKDDLTTSNQAFGTLYGQYELPAGLNYRLNLGFSYDDRRNSFFQMAGGMPRQNNPRDPAFLNVGRDNYTSLLVENLLNFNRRFGLHDVNAVAGYTEQRNDREWLWASRRDYADESLRNINAGISNLNNSGFSVESRLRSFLGRVNYALADRYLLTASYRRDGSSRFGPENRWGDFYAGSLGWVVSDEPFFQTIPGLGRASFLKIRGSYGTLGNQDFDDYQFAGLIAQNQSYLFGGSVAPGAIMINLANPFIKWQQNTQQNYGFDLGLFNDALSLSADYYVSRSSDLLVRAPLPQSLGSTASPFVNAGEVQNKGFELELAHRLRRGDLSLNTNLNLTTIRNEVLSLGNNAQPLFASVARTAVGEPIGHFWVYRHLGIFQSQADVQAHTTTLPDGTVRVLQPNARPGDVIYADLNGDGFVNDLDRYNAGNPVPDLEGGLHIDAAYRRFDFSVGMRGSYGNEIFNDTGWWMLRMDDNSNLPKGTQYWTPENPSTTMPRPLIGGAAAMNARHNSDRWVEDGSYLRLQTIQLGYSLPENVLSRAGVNLNNARVYLNLQNLHTFTRYTGFDPEFVGWMSGVSSLERGIDFGRVYPNPRTITFGVDIEL